jgi:hypothetical protein
MTYFHSIKVEEVGNQGKKRWSGGGWDGGARHQN